LSPRDGFSQADTDNYLVTGIGGGFYYNGIDYEGWLKSGGIVTVNTCSADLKLFTRYHGFKPDLCRLDPCRRLRYEVLPRQE